MRYVLDSMPWEVRLFVFVSRLPQENLAVELLRKLLSEGIKTRSRRNVVQSHEFSELLLSSIRKYENGAIEAALCHPESL